MPAELASDFENFKGNHVAVDKAIRRDLDTLLQFLKQESDPKYTGIREPNWPLRSSRERSLAVTKIQEAIMWLGMDLKAINEESPGSAPNPYPESYNPASAKIEPTSEGLKL
jgi:hypothetical protein